MAANPFVAPFGSERIYALFWGHFDSERDRSGLKSK